ncbi:MAG: asparagine synthase-related protein, partial [Dehalococcoidia bacterium]
AAPDPAHDLVRLIAQVGLPFGDSSLLPTYWVSAAAREHAAVALAGDGGDELFGGYERYRASFLAKRWGRALALLPLPDAPPGHPKSSIAKLARISSASRWQGYRDLHSIFPAPLLGALIGKQFQRIDDQWPDDPLRIDFGHPAFGYLPADLLRKTDTAAMAVALEVRAPMLARGVIDACLGATHLSLMPRGQRKGLLRAVARKYFPPEIVDRPKQGFAIPIGEWFRSDYGGMRQLLLDHLNGPEPFGPDRLGINGTINMGFVRQMLREHDDAGAKSLWPWKGRDHSQRLYMLLVLSIWGKWLGGLG